MQKIKWKNSAALLLAAFVWGVAFVAQSVGMDYVEPFTFNGIRCLIGSLVLLPCIFFFDRFKTSEEKEAVKAVRHSGLVVFFAEPSFLWQRMHSR